MSWGGQDSDDPTASQQSTPTRLQLHTFLTSRGAHVCARSPRKSRSPPPTSVSQLEPLPVLGVVAVEVDEGLVGGAQQGGGQVGTAELPDQRAGAVWPILDLQEVVIRLRGEVQELDVSTCGHTRHAWTLLSSVHHRRLPKAAATLFMSPNALQGRDRGWRRPRGRVGYSRPWFSSPSAPRRGDLSCPESAYVSAGTVLPMSQGQRSEARRAGWSHAHTVTVEF